MRKNSYYDLKLHTNTNKKGSDIENSIYLPKRHVYVT